MNRVLCAGKYVERVFISLLRKLIYQNKHTSPATNRVAESIKKHNAISLFDIFLIFECLNRFLIETNRNWFKQSIVSLKEDSQF